MDGQRGGSKTWNVCGVLYGSLCGVLEANRKESSMGREQSAMDHEAEVSKLGSDEKGVFPGL